MTRAFANVMKKKKYGRIINIASMYGMVGNMAMGTIAYHTSKGGVINFTRAAASELAKEGITVNAICPGYFDTELTHETLITPEFTQYMQATVPIGRYGVEGELNAHGGSHEVYESVKPGITGWWACNGRSATTYKKRLELEYYYIKNCSLWLDIKCIFLTAMAVIRKTGAK